MKRFFETAVAIVLFFAFGASMSTATTNIDSVDHYAKVLLDGSYIDFSCTAQSSATNARPTDPTATTTTTAISPTVSAARVDIPTDPSAAASSSLGVAVTDVVASRSLIDDSQTGNVFSITVYFSGEMNRSVDPTIQLFPDLVASGTLAFNDILWSADGMVYTVFYTVVDHNEVQNSVSASVYGGFSSGILGLPVDAYTAHGVFAVDMLTSAAASSPLLTSPCNVIVSDHTVTGSAWGSTVGTVVMDEPGGGVFNDGYGTLSGYAWSETAGWINFAPINGGVTIDGDGYFHGLAWSQNIGWIAFNCDTLGTCTIDPFRVRTSWRPGAANILTPIPIDPVIVPTMPVSVSTPVPSENTPVPVETPSPTPTPGSSSSPTPSPTSPVTPTPPGTSTPAPTSTPTPGTTPAFPSPSGTPSTNNPVIEQITVVVDEVTETISRGVESASVALDTPMGQNAFKAIVLAGVVAALVSSSGSAWRSAFSVLAFRKRKPWGTVYDSITKQPLDPAYVILKDADGNEINTSITDLDGRYGFLTGLGSYSIIANKTHYMFPSTRLAGRTSDELYTDLYFGGPIMIASTGDVITKNIPMDAVNFDWNEYAKKEQSLLKFYSKRTLWIARVTNVLFWFGFGLSTFALIVAPEPLNIGIFALYIAVFALKETLLKPRKQGMIADRAGNPMAFAILRIFSAQLNTEIAHKAANALGQYFALVPNDNYYVKVEKKNPDGSYAPVYTSEAFEVKKGVINRSFEI